MCSIQSRRVRGLVARAVFRIEGFEVWARGLDTRSKGSRFGRVCAIRDRRVRSLVAWIFLMSKGSRFGRLVAKSNIS